MGGAARFWSTYGEAARTAVGFFWKAGWAFVLGYGVSAMIQAFVPRDRLTPYLGSAGLRSVSLATLFGAASSSCSFAALAAARALVLKGASFVAAIAFMFASTNLVIELGILILIFLGWQFLAAEILGGLLLIAISTILVRLTAPTAWFRESREALQQKADAGDEDFDWRRRIRSREGWELVGRKFVSDWKMVWEEILIGFTIAGFMAVLVPASVWERVFLMRAAGALPDWVVVVENAVVAPFVAAATFIGSMGNIPLATVLNANGVLFAGIMGFIYSDLMVPPLVMINVRYYGWRVAVYIAGIMFASIVITALTLHYGFGALGIIPESGHRVAETVQFALDYTFYLNLLFAGVAAVLVRLGLAGGERERQGWRMHLGPKRVLSLVCVLVLLIGLGASFMSPA
ncbi:MAG: permease [Acidobacteriota bacterium]|jgi:uncharacterized membrane protein YraQ (UPF0718 family)